jgi:hypothetical protein
MNPLNQDFREFIALLEANAVEYLVVTPDVPRIVLGQAERGLSLKIPPDH